MPVRYNYKLVRYAKKNLHGEEPDAELRQVLVLPELLV